MKKKLIFVIIISFLLYSIVHASQSVQTILHIEIFDDDLINPFIIKAMPEKRVSKLGGNYSSKYILSFYRNDNNLLTGYESVITDNAIGESFVTPLNVNAWRYNVFIKGTSHLSKRKNNILFNNIDPVSLNFSEDEYYLKAGDLNTRTTIEDIPIGDDKVNSLDISVIINNLNIFDYRSDLNMDGIVNSLDLSILITNIDEIGETLQP